MRLLQIISLLLVFTSLPAISHASDVIPKCTDKLCDAVATEVSFEHTPLNDFVKVKLGHFTINVPTGAEEIHHVGDDLFFIYEGKKTLVVGQSKGTFAEDTKLKILKPNMFPEVLFTKTSMDSEPEGADDLLYWRHALHQKVNYFNKNQSIISMQDGKLSYYLTVCYSEYFTNKGLVSDADYADYFVQVEAKNFSADEFKNILTSVKSTQEK